MQMLDGFKEIYRYQVYPDFILLRMIDKVSHMRRWQWSSIFWMKYILKVALSQKRLEDFYIAKINIPNHYPEQKI